jgi:DNA-binding LytR/AlgR family response regulator
MIYEYVLNIAICDDNRECINILEERIKTILCENKRKSEIKTFLSSTDLIEQFRRQPADIVFLDIEMPGISGDEAAKIIREIKNDVTIVFVTDHDHMVFQMFDNCPFWFIRKSHLQDLRSMFLQAFQHLDESKAKERGFISVVSENKNINVNINKVKYIEADNHYIVIVNSDDTRERVRCRISDAERQLSSAYFVRVQNGIIVNIRFISEINSREVILNNGEKINIGRGRADIVKREFQRFIRSK